jgi:hypothetical protein
MPNHFSPGEIDASRPNHFVNWKRRMWSLLKGTQFIFHIPHKTDPDMILNIC